MKTIEASISQLDLIIHEIGRVAPDVVILIGTLSSGKTTLVQHYAKALGIDEAVTSPTFLGQHNYGDQIYHYDLYLHNQADKSFDFLESLQAKGIHFVEWGDKELSRRLQALGFEVITITIEINQHNRRYTIE